MAHEQETMTTGDHMTDGGVPDHMNMSGATQYHEQGTIQDGLAVDLNVTPLPVITASSTRFDFLVNQKPGNEAIPLSSLQLEHTKYMHVIGVRSDMNEFFHIHPVESTTTPGILSVNYAFANPGQYKIWSEIKKDGVNYAFGHPAVAVQGAGVTEKKQVSFARQFVIDNYQAVLSLDEPVVKGHAHALTFEIHTRDNQEVKLDDYLAAKMHLTLIKDDWKQLIHTHPEGPGHAATLRIINRASANGGDQHAAPPADNHGIRFQVVFLEAGIYKAFAQFRLKNSALPPDTALTAEFWIEVKDKAPPAISVWTGLFIVSLVTMGILSWLVRKYLKVL
jgi:hypothetical protein